MTRQRLIAFGIALLSSVAAWAGGFWLEFGNPSASSDPQAKGAVLLVRPTGCGEPAKAVMTATATGMVKGEQKSLTLQPTPLAQPGLYALKQTWPAEGTWVVTVTANYEGRTTSAIAPIGPQGFDRKLAKYLPHAPSTQEVQEMLIAATK